MLSEELLLRLEVDSETSLVEMVSIVDRHMEKYHEPPTTEQWENLADVAFLVFYHNKPRAFSLAVEIIGRVLAQGFTNWDAAEGALRSVCLRCSDDPVTDRMLVSYMLGHLKGALRAFRLSGLDEGFKEETRKLIEWYLQR